MRPEDSLELARDLVKWLMLPRIYKIRAMTNGITFGVRVRGSARRALFRLDHLKPFLFSIECNDTLSRCIVRKMHICEMYRVAFVIRSQLLEFR
jgi:hypothetical protein